MALDYGTLGISFPFRLDETGRVAVSGISVEDQEFPHIEESVQQILLTRIGERFFRRDFGADIDNIVFEPNASLSLAVLRTDIEDAITRWDPRVQILDVRMLDSDPGRGLLFAQVSYAIAGLTGLGSNRVMDVILDVGTGG